jgi:aspartate ammonia-lyase
MTLGQEFKAFANTLADEVSKRSRRCSACCAR